jgi:hypothetical protein
LWTALLYSWLRPKACWVRSVTSPSKRPVEAGLNGPVASMQTIDNSELKAVVRQSAIP